MSLILVCAVCLGLFGRQLVFEILEHLQYRDDKTEIHTNIIDSDIDTSKLEHTTGRLLFNHCHGKPRYVMFVDNRSDDQ